jgi:hypothetical protein
MKPKKFKPIAVFLIALLSLASFNTAWTKSADAKVKDFIDDAASTLKKGVDKFENNFEAAQEYLDNYHWKGFIQDKATSGPAKLEDFRLRNHSNVLIVKPGERIEGSVTCDLDAEKCSPLKLYRVVLGYKGLGGQTTVCNYLGAVAGKSTEAFVLTAPSIQGFYQIRFRVVEELFEEAALKHWVDENGNEPDGATTLGLIYVKA